LYSAGKLENVTNSILNDIVADKKKEITRKKRETPLTVMIERAKNRRPRDFAAALKGKELKLIAEVKKASPSKGVLVTDFDPLRLAKIYAENGAAAISVLTDEKYFQGKLEYLAAISHEVNIPVLRKDFILDKYQVYESVVHGADAILLITAILTPEQLEGLLKLSKSLNLSCLVEVHDEKEMFKALLAGAEIIGINNRDLATFSVDINTTRRLRMLVPQEQIVVSESGIHDKNDIKKMRECKVNAVLVGEALVTAGDIKTKMKELLS
jgi:indole-3-glycerol phosphate synthase